MKLAEYLAANPNAKPLYASMMRGHLLNKDHELDALIVPILKYAIDSLVWVQTSVYRWGEFMPLYEAGLSDHPDDYEINPAISQGLYETLHSFVESALEIDPNIFDAWSPEQIGLDFILTTNGHGAGFWDRGLPYGDELTELCKPFGTISAYLDEERNTIEPWEGFERN